MAEKKYIDSGQLYNAVWKRNRLCKNDLLELIDSQPAADVVEVKHGYWKKRTAYPMGYNCSDCNNSETHKSPFCRLCGARMDGKERE